ncbi:hypothetical protein ASPBRDRAFT_593403 [Aspergillus brasiliensis CBS 101740]|uniref:Uncharacterized protein n=1 Tax=Aspergillus brasiliensis (strain CBS 101740 / IMI 381727 / IBT 21946) TaxID=767769 RepID=A0A1L9UGS6_ASPBC|nr:hypothetical protein ASPBRDRAFT_593403 [Aspergillus brasiliensis CBS 101740]
MRGEHHWQEDIVSQQWPAEKYKEGARGSGRIKQKHGKGRRTSSPSNRTGPLLGSSVICNSSVRPSGTKFALTNQPRFIELLLASWLIFYLYWLLSPSLIQFHYRLRSFSPLSVGGFFFLSSPSRPGVTQPCWSDRFVFPVRFISLSR